MNKIKINLVPQKNKVVKFQGYKVEIKPYIKTETVMFLTNLCESLIFKDKLAIQQSFILRVVFDMVVLSECTNIEVPTVRKKKGKGKDISLDVNLDKKSIEQFEASGIVEFIRPFIFNYEETWNTIRDFVNNAILIYAMSLFGDKVPSSEEMESSLTAVKDMFKDIQKEHPEVIQDAVMKPIINKVKKDSKK